MRPTPIPEDEVWPGSKRVTIAPPGGDFLDPDVSAVEALLEKGQGRVNRYSVRLVPEGDDLARLNRGDPVWLSIICPQMPVFSIGFAVFSVPTGRCRNCQKPITWESATKEIGPETVVFHEHPGDGPPCPTPEIEWVEANPPNISDPLAKAADLQEAIGRRAEELWPGEGVESAGLGLAEEAGEVCRALVKRIHGTRGTPVAWTAQVRREAAQVVVTCLDLAHREGFDLWSAVEEQAEAFLAMDRNHDPIEGP